MTKLVLPALVFLSLSASASQMLYDVEFQLSLNGKHDSSYHMIAPEGEKASISQKVEEVQTSIEFVAKEGEIQGHKGILMDVVITKIGSDGKPIIIGRPKVLASENSPTEITMGATGKDSYQLIVTAKRKSL